MIQKLPPTMMKISTTVKTMASRFSFGVVVKLMCRKKRRWTSTCSTAAMPMTNAPGMPTLPAAGVIATTLAWLSGSFKPQISDLTDALPYSDRQVQRGRQSLEAILDRRDRMLDRRVVQLHHVGTFRSRPLQAPGQVDQHDVAGQTLDDGLVDALQVSRDQCPDLFELHSRDKPSGRCSYGKPGMVPIAPRQGNGGIPLSA